MAARGGLRAGVPDRRAADFKPRSFAASRPGGPEGHYPGPQRSMRRPHRPVVLRDAGRPCTNCLDWYLIESPNNKINRRVAVALQRGALLRTTRADRRRGIPQRLSADLLDDPQCDCRACQQVCLPEDDRLSEAGSAPRSAGQTGSAVRSVL